jgi:Transposase DDE domain group 1/Family of unknown function (DUF5681)
MERPVPVNFLQIEDTGRDARGRFAKGRCGNPAGKPRGARHRKTLAAELLLESEARRLTRKAVELALTGDPTALKLCLERTLAPRRGRAVRIALPPVASAADLAGMMAAMIDLFCDSFEEVPRRILLDIDDTEDRVHGGQQLSLWNAHYDSRCFLPIHVYEATTGKPVAVILRPGKTPDGAEVALVLRHVIGRIRARWPKVEIPRVAALPRPRAGSVRGDSHYGRPEAMAWGSSCAASISAIISAIRCSASRSSTSSTRARPSTASLQRAVYNGVITAKHRRTTEELGAISGALPLLANIVMAWNTHRLQLAVDQASGEYPDEVLSRIAPIGYKHINLRVCATRLSFRAEVRSRPNGFSTITRACSANLDAPSPLIISKSEGGIAR